MSVSQNFLIVVEVGGESVKPEVGLLHREGVKQFLPRFEGVINLDSPMWMSMRQSLVCRALAFSSG